MSSFHDKVNSLVQVHYRFHSKENRSPVELVTEPILNLHRDWLNNEITQCSKCESICGNKTIIRGNLQEAKALVIGDSPGVEVLQNDEPCFPFEVEGVYDNLNDLLDEAGVLDSLVWCNVVNCHTYRNSNGVYQVARPPKSKEISNCSTFLFDLLNCMIMAKKLTCIITMGNLALNTLLPGTRISEVRGTEIYYRGIPLFVTHTPVGLTEKKLEEFNEDVDSFISFLRDDEEEDIDG